MFDFDTFWKWAFFDFFGDKIWKNVEVPTSSKLIEFNSFLITFVTICIFSLTKSYKILLFWQNRDWRVSKFCVQVFKFVWQVPTLLSSFSRPNSCHTLSKFTTKKISLSWCDFVKESCPNSSYWSTKRRNQIVTKKFQLIWYQIWIANLNCVKLNLTSQNMLIKYQQKM